MNKRMQNRLIAALALAQEEIHHPGSARASGIDIAALVEGVLKEAAPRAEIARWTKEALGELRNPTLANAIMP